MELERPPDAPLPPGISFIVCPEQALPALAELGLPAIVLRRPAAVADGNGRGPVLGIVASFSDITRQQELQQTKNDVISLVSHEMRTPLTAIQGMTELLANYDVPGDRRREMNLAINDEVKRLTRMISEYLDITRLESGATPMRLSPVRVRFVYLVQRVEGKVLLAEGYTVHATLDATGKPTRLPARAHAVFTHQPEARAHRRSDRRAGGEG